MPRAVLAATLFAVLAGPVAAGSAPIHAVPSTGPAGDLAGEVIDTLRSQCRTGVRDRASRLCRYALAGAPSVVITYHQGAGNTRIGG